MIRSTVRGRVARVLMAAGLLGSVAGAAERYWVSGRA